MNKINWDSEKENLKELIEKRYSYSAIAKMYGIKNGSNIKRVAIRLGIEIVDSKTGKLYEVHNGPYKCKHCGELFDDRRKLAGHSTFCKKNPKYEHNIEELNKVRGKIKENVSKDIKSFICTHCGKEFITNIGAFSIHEKTCEMNSNKEKWCGNKGHTVGYEAWNKGKTCLDDERILTYTQNRIKSIENGTYVPKCTPHTDETKRHLREKMIEYIKKTGNGEFGQHFSIKGCEYIESLNERMGWNLVHAKNGR